MGPASHEAGYKGKRRSPVVLPGETTVVLKSAQPWLGAVGGETRALGLCVFGLEFAVRR